MKKPEITEEGMKNFIGALSEALMNEEGVDPLKVWSKEQLESEPEHLRLMTLFPLEVSIDGYLRKNNLSPIRLEWDKVEGFLNGIFERFEGPVCCVDKSRYLLNKFIYSKEKKTQFILEEKKEKEFWKPIFLDAGVWETLITYYIRPRLYEFDKYILALGQLLKFYSDREKNNKER